LSGVLNGAEKNTMNAKRLGGLAAGSLLLMTGCHLPFTSPKAPTGQVAATVDGKEITLTQLQSEMASLPAGGPADQKAREQAALTAIVNRRLIADYAQKQGLDKTPAFAVQMSRARDVVLFEALQQQLARQIPAPTSDEAQTFISNNPDMFAQRKVYAIDQVQFPRNVSPDIIKGLTPINDLASVEAFLEAHKIPHKRVSVVLDALTADPHLVQAIAKLPAGELFVVGSNNAFLVNQIKETKTVPVPNDQAEKLAIASIKRNRTQEAISKEFGSIVAQGRSAVRFNPAFAPPAQSLVSSPNKAPAKTTGH
jgi:peptidyl-prolyl cis-trans isomerase C